MTLRGNRFLRFLDSFFGRALVGCLIRRRRTRPEKVTSIAVLKLVGIGDLILVSALLEKLKGAYPQAEITLFCGKENACVVPLLAVDRVVAVPVGKPWKSVPLVRQRAFDLFIDCGQWARLDALLTYCARAGWTVGFETEGQHRHRLYDGAVKHRSDRHEVENFLALVEGEGALPKLAYPKERLVEGPYVVFHPWAAGIRSELKRWPRSHWIELGKRLSWPVIITGGPSDRVEAEGLAEEMGARSVAGALSLEETASLVHHATCVVSVNTGVMHLAAATGAPLVALHGPTSVKRWGPVGGGVSLVPEGVPHGYLNLGFEYARGGACMDRITVEAVYLAVLSQSTAASA